MKKHKKVIKKAVKRVVKKAAKKVSKKLLKKPAAKSKVKKVMHEFAMGELHSGSKKGPVVTNPRQGIAIALSEAKRKVKGK